MIDDMRLIEDISILRKGNLILYGSADRGKRMAAILKNMGVQQAYFCDSDSRKWGTYTNSIEVLSPTQLGRLAMNMELTVIVTSQHVDEIAGILENIGISDIFTEFGVEYALLLNLNTGFFTAEAVTWYRWKKACYGVGLKNPNGVEQLKLLTEILHENDTAILIYQSGKVGSGSVYKKILPYKPAIHLHFLTHKFIVKKFDACLDLNENFKYLYHHFQNELTGKKIKIITLIRDPVAQMVSKFVYSLGLGAWLYQYHPMKLHFDEGIGSLYNIFEQFAADEINPDVQQNLRYGYEFDWFDEELKHVFGVDIYQTAFNKDLGYCIVQKGDIEVLCMQTEKMNQLNAVISTFAGVPEMPLERVNAGDDNVYRYAYPTFRKNLCISKEVLDFYYQNNKAMQHFYSEQDIKKFRGQWES